MRLFIQAVDVWLFRDGKPFDAASDHRARSLFPPYPSTMQGAIRSKALALSKVDPGDYANRHRNAQAIGETIGWPGEGYGRLQIRGPFVARQYREQIIRYFPMPSDVVKVQMSAKSRYTTLSPLSDSPFANNSPTGICPLWIHTNKRIEDASGWLSEEELGKYLIGDPLTPTMTDQLFEREARFGIRLDNIMRRVEEGHLYEAEFIRPHKDVGLSVDVDGLEDWQSSGILGIGGESRSALYNVVKHSEDKIAIPKPDKDGKTRFKLYFATPAYFEGGWKPKDGNWSGFFSKDVRLVSASLGRTHMIGGARIDRKSQSSGLFQKPMRRYLPAGSVYFFEAEGQISYSGIPVTESPEGEGDLGQIGFGQVFIGRWQYV